MFDADPVGGTASPAPSPAYVRDRSEVRIRFVNRAGTTFAADRFEAGNLRARFPRNLGHCQGILLNTGGGIAGGDQIVLSLELGSAADAVVTTQAAEKIYRSDGVAAAIDARLSLAPGARLAYLPQETILFDAARLERRLTADLAPDAVLTLVETTVYGRAASGEVLRSGFFRDRWDIRRGGRVVFAERVRIEGAISSALARAAIGKGAGAVATLLHAAPDAGDRLAAMRAALADVPATADCGFGATCIGDVLVVRFVGHHSAAVRPCVAAALTRGLGIALPRSWKL